MFIKKHLSKIRLLRNWSVIVFIITITCSPVESQVKEIVNARIMFYNAENMFDTEDDYLTDDDEFLPGGLRGWTLSRYSNKLNSVFQTIAAAGEWSPPEIIGFAEIENRKVIEDLINNTNLSAFDYDVVHTESPDPRGIDVGLIFRKDIVKIIEYRSLIPKGFTGDEFRSRSVLLVKCTITTDTFHLLINHWPSRLGGVLKKENLRSEISELVRVTSDSIMKSADNKAKIVIIGDFNCEWSDREMSILTGKGNKSGSGSDLINLSITEAKSGGGSYKYQGKWEMLDQIIVSDFLMNCKTGFYTDTCLFRVIDNDFLKKSDEKYPGKTTFSTYSGYKYTGGYSDHFPVIIELVRR